MEWKQEYSVDIEIIDAQHKELFKRINNLVQDIKLKRCKLTIDGTTKFLEDYVVSHFGAEERYMQECGYPGLELHRAHHQKFMADFEALKRELAAEHSSYGRSVRTNQIVVDWIIGHVTSEDREFGAYLKEKGITLRPH